MNSVLTETLLPTRAPSELILPAQLARVALNDLITPYGVQASNWELFKDAVFGRDSEAVLRDVDGFMPEMFPRVMSSLSKYQGRKTNKVSGEEPGRGFHELRLEDVGGSEQRAIYHQLSAQNGIGHDGLYLDYGTLDAPPQMIRAIDEHVKRYGSEVLEQKIPYWDDEITIGKAAELTAEWTSDRIKRSDLGFLDRLPDSGVTGNSQTMRDGAVSYLHENGRLANFKKPVASIEVQGLAYDALLSAASLVGSEEQKERWRNQAEKLRLRTFEHFWMPDRNNWAMAVDIDEAGHPRQLKTRTSLPAELLETGIFENLPKGFDQEKMIRPLVETIFSPDMLTAVGPRMRSLHYANLLPYADYQGSWMVWPVNANSIAKGLDRYGFHSLERDIALRTLAGTVGVAGSFPEFMIVNPAGEVCWPLYTENAPDNVTDILKTTNFPELKQAWTISAVLRMQMEPCHEADPDDWRGALCEKIRRDLLVRPSIVQLHPHILDRTGASLLERAVA